MVSSRYGFHPVCTGITTINMWAANLSNMVFYSTKQPTVQITITAISRDICTRFARIFVLYLVQFDNKYILFDGLTYNTRGYFASCVYTSNEQNVRSYYMLNHRIRDLLFRNSSVRFVWPFCRSSSVRMFALFYSVITWHILRVLLP